MPLLAAVGQEGISGAAGIRVPWVGEAWQGWGIIPEPGVDSEMTLKGH